MKRILVLLSTILFWLNTTAQIFIEPQAAFGHCFYNANRGAFDYSQTLQGRIQVAYTFSSRLQLVSGLGMSRFYAEIGTRPSNTGDQNLYFVDIPLALRIHLKRQLSGRKSAGFYVQPGLVFHILAAAHIKPEEPLYASAPRDRDNEDDYYRLVPGATLDIGWLIPVSEHINIDAGWSLALGLMNALKANYHGPSNLTSYNTNLALNYNSVHLGVLVKLQ